MEKQELERLYLELEKYKYISEKLNNPYLTEIETEKFIKDNYEKIKEINIIRKKISTIEWNQLTLEQQKDYLEKYSDD
ncbi:conserved hypothetical protein [Flavobacterium sp. 9AF]|uniref:hypothetical protein n=1 Tax=Flavobacterium sp. 9AF TaxID=2653142 RepID=UPI0012F06368|nr:hypothetical protein [Flavobacterium sp. 9AF]VXC25439.1 conserved hypothetical protein [Flavobacterium sp. 9AF]